MNNQFRGSIAEYRVVVDLMSKGYFVFVQSTPCSPFDIITERHGQLLKIEVRTGRYSSTGKVYHNRSYKSPSADILATVLPDQIVYLPDLNYKALESI